MYPLSGRSLLVSCQQLSVRCRNQPPIFVRRWRWWVGHAKSNRAGRLTSFERLAFTTIHIHQLTILDATQLYTNDYVSLEA